VIDIGPGAGDEGGRIVTEGIPQDVAKNKESKTARYLSATLS
jgi:excinuclease ABC subunit A